MVTFDWLSDNTPGLTAPDGHLKPELKAELDAAAVEWQKGLSGHGTINVGIHEGAPNAMDNVVTHFDTLGIPEGDGREIFYPLGESQALGWGAGFSTTPGGSVHAMDIYLNLDRLAHAADPVSVLANAIGHGLGITGWMNDPTLSTHAASTFDSHVVRAEDGRFVFEGQHSGQVPLGNDTYDVAGPDLMNDPVPAHATVSTRHFAMLADMGYAIDHSIVPDPHHQPDFGDIPSG